MRLSILTSALILTACNGPSQPRSGFINLTSQDGMMSFGVAGFATAPANTCTTETIGPCSVLRCELTSARPGGPVLDSAGIITVEGGLAGFTLEKGAPYYRGPVSPVSPMWKGGETLTVSATGGDVPAFSGVTVLAPNPIQVTSPACELDFPHPCRVPRNADLTLAWTGGANTTVRAQLSGSNSATTHTAATCNFQSSPASIPAAVLAVFDTFEMFVLDVSDVNSKDFTSGDYAITLNASHNAMSTFVAFSN